MAGMKERKCVLMKLLFRIRMPLTLLLCAALLCALCACSLSDVAANAPKATAGEAFALLEDPSLIDSVTIAYTSVLTETLTETLRNEDTIEQLCQAINAAGTGLKSVAWNVHTDSVDGGEGYLITLNFSDGTAKTLGFVLNPTKGHLSVTTDGAETLYYEVGVDALNNLASFYPA